MYNFSNVSEQRLLTCHASIQTVCRTVIQDYDFMVLCGYRDETEQNNAYNSGASQLEYPKSKHNTMPSLAVDLAPYPIDWDDLKRFHELAGRVLEVASLLNIQIAWGGHWKKFKDYPHFELVINI
jgi:peptidoglycan L-alanyl-D-glutamate endopeptidase CwlK